MVDNGRAGNMMERVLTLSLFTCVKTTSTGN